MPNSVTFSTSADVSATGWQVVQPKRPTALDNSEAGHNTAVSKCEPSTPKAAPADVGTALRNAFRATVDEDIPAAMLDLLRRLD